MQAQALGVLWLMTREDMVSFATSRPLIQKALVPCFVMFDSQAEATQLTNASLEPVGELLRVGDPAAVGRPGQTS